MGLPPSAGAVHVTVAEPLPARADTPIGAAGAVAPAGTTAFDGVDAGPVPTALVAVDRKSTRLNSSHSLTSRMPSSARKKKTTTATYPSTTTRSLNRRTAT